MSWAALPWATSKGLKPSPAFRFFSLCLKTKGNQGQKEESRRLPEKKSYCISRNIFCINWKEEKKNHFWRIHVFFIELILHHTCKAELQAGGKSLSHTVPFHFQHHLLSSLSHGHSLLGSSLSHSSQDLHTENHPSHFTITGWFTWKNNFC